MKYLLLLSVFLYQHVFSQNTIYGIVLNGLDNSKLPAASIFINNATKGTLSDGDGKFILSGITENNFELVISYSGFATASIKMTPGNIPQFQTIKLYPRKSELQEVSVMAPEKDGWKKWGRLFTESFIGTSDFAEQCTIKNPEVLRFFYNKNSGILKAYSHGNLIIYNKALGYNVRYQLEEFVKDPRKRTISYFGYTGFEDLDTKNKHKEKKWDNNRRIAYRGSVMHFMRSLYVGKTVEEGFDVREKIKLNNKDSAFEQIYRNGNIPAKVRIDSNEYVPVVLRNQSGNVPEFMDLICTKPFSFKNAVVCDSATQPAIFYFVNHLRIIYKNAKEKDEYLRQNMQPLYRSAFQTSDIFLVNNEAVTIESNGLYFDPLNIIASGYWGWCKMAETLPSDYQVEEK